MKESVIVENSRHISNTRDEFRKEVIAGLNKMQKSLPSKYFYDKNGDKLFQEIMACDEYYLTRSEMEIFTQQKEILASSINTDDQPFDIIELGAGDGSKTIHLLEYFSEQKIDFDYMPVDISGNILSILENFVHSRLPNLPIVKLQGDYLEMLDKASQLSTRRKIILFLGSNIGNLNVDDAVIFCKKVRATLQPGDIFLIGFDLMKNPKLIRAAYEDAMGITKEFNLNLLYRMNRELNADFDVNKFDHYCNYDPETGACKSYLVSLEKQVVHFLEEEIAFKKDELIWTEISQKYSMEMIKDLAMKSGFTITKFLTDTQTWFTDVILTATN